MLGRERVARRRNGVPARRDQPEETRQLLLGTREPPAAVNPDDQRQRIPAALRAVEIKQVVGAGAIALVTTDVHAARVVPGKYPRGGGAPIREQATQKRYRRTRTYEQSRPDRQQAEPHRKPPMQPDPLGHRQTGRGASSR
jgi:hypothetical protein